MTDNTTLVMELRATSMWRDPDAKSVMLRAADALEAITPASPALDDGALRDVIDAVESETVYNPDQFDCARTVTLKVALAAMRRVNRQTVPMVVTDEMKAALLPFVKFHSVYEKENSWLPTTIVTQCFSKGTENSVGTITVQHLRDATAALKEGPQQPGVDRNAVIEAARETVAKFDALPPTQANVVPALGINLLRRALKESE